MNEIIIIGGTGFAGRHLITSLLSQKDIKIRVLRHKDNPDEVLSNDRLTVINGDLLRPETLTGLCVGNAIVINLAYIRNGSSQDNLSAIKNLLAACAKAKIKRFIHCSTAVVAGRVRGDIVTEETACYPISEYETTKRQIEKTVLENAGKAFEAVILRPTAIFGAGGKNLLKLADDLLFGNRIANYFKSCLFHERKMNLVSVHNVVSAIELLIYTNKNIDEEIFIVSDDEYNGNNYYDVERNLMEKFGLKSYPIPIVHIPLFVLKGILKLIGKSNYNPRCTYNCQKLFDLGFKKTVIFEDELANFASWYKHYLAVQKNIP